MYKLKNLYIEYVISYDSYVASSKISARPETSNERLRNHESCGLELIESYYYNSIHNLPAQKQFVKLS